MSSSLPESTIFPQYGGPSWADIVRQLNEGDRVHVEWPVYHGDINWRSYWVTESGNDYVEFGDDTEHRIEVSHEDYAVRSSLGDEGVKVFEKQGSEWVNTEYTDGINGIERVPQSEFDGTDWYHWEIYVSEMEGDSPSDVAVYPESPTRELAEKKAKRWAGMASGYTPVVYREERIDHND